MTTINQTLTAFHHGFDFGLSILTLMMKGGDSAAYNLGAILGYMAPGMILGALVMYLLAKSQGLKY